MSFVINYEKRKNSNIFQKFSKSKNILVTEAQNYIPIYQNVFTLSSTNYQNINLNHYYYINEIVNAESNNVYTCKLKFNLEEDSTVLTKKIFVKLAPLLDPYKYLIGKYDINNPKLFELPTLDGSCTSHSKILSPNNSSYIDGFFTYLSSQLLNYHQIIHGIDYYGSFLGIKKNYKINVVDDIEHLAESAFFLHNKGILFDIENYEHLLDNFDESSRTCLKSLQILDNEVDLKIDETPFLDDSIFEDIFVTSSSTLTEEVVNLDELVSQDLGLIDITNTVPIMDNKDIKSLKSNSTCSSRCSYTEDEDGSSSDSDVETISNPKKSRCDASTLDTESCSNSDSDSVSGTDSDSEEEELFATIHTFPIQMICMEQCENTLDYLILNEKIQDDQWFSALFQVIMTLIFYQKCFSFTHNDLHTNNIMYIPTTKKFLYYCYENTYYKVPTYGRIFKIIDFGRAIYKFKGNIYCSDSFEYGGDASTQYNCEPYFNDKKSRLDPNFSFDLCRLACSIFDYVVPETGNQEENTNKSDRLSPIAELMTEWCIDDKGLNVLYKNNGMERYPDFKLYKMIARCVHKHTPQAQLERKEFSKYRVEKKNVNKSEIVMNIDSVPIYI
jgi:hypothetical protein